MAQSSWPYENLDTSETQFSQWARNIGEGVKSSSLNELEVFADSTGMQVKAKSGQAMVRGHYYQNTAVEVLTLTAADLSNPRIDTVVIELDPSANSIVLKVIAGTPAGSPTPTPLVQTDAGVYQFKLAEVAVASSAITITAGAVTDGRTYLGAFTGTVPGSAITGQITTATIDGDRLLNNIDTATIGQANVTDLTADLSAITGDIATNTASISNPLATFVTDATTARTLTSTEMGKTVLFTSASATVVTVNASTDFTVGARVDIVANGSSELTILASGATLAGAEVSTTTGSFTIGLQYSAATLLCVATDSYLIIGNVSVV
tara:strand:- start:601 stop:1563 length:963 start_codon:yes stop_codon:yes gene_type:complete